ncbi:hypothetical protein LR48_Vigan07g051900 [Vigna angularis]|uniref:HMA domain-containing protein n=1 Tax=Phaseolus angularis TaxID=3914 RepID=A0A0L9UVC2_PHAAN|nr:heavy metal-associated isoprenylated plant protein 47-like [Vigna angularis]KOM46815.1 hypothetical protein LR48_Vigan07g051900 [Vigna angularis]
MQKIVIQVRMENDKCRSKAMKIAAASQGVHSVALEGEDRDQVVVTGDAIDSVCLTNKLRKKFKYATLMSVTDENEDGDAGGEQKDQITIEKIFPIPYCYSNFPPPSHLYVVDYDSYPNACSIL